MVGSNLVNYLMYTDDPSSAGIKERLHSKYGLNYDIKYNASKIVIVICRKRDGKVSKI